MRIRPDDGTTTTTMSSHSHSRPHTHAYSPHSHSHSRPHVHAYSPLHGTNNTANTANNNRIRIAIIGAGISGLTLALAIRRSSSYAPHLFDIQIFEQAPGGFKSLTGGGEGMILYPRGVEILKSLSLRVGGGGTTGDLGKGYVAMACRAVGDVVGVDGKMMSVRKSFVGGNNGEEKEGTTWSDLVTGSHQRELMASITDSLPMLPPTPSPSPDSFSGSGSGSGSKEKRIPAAALSAFNRTHLLELLATYLPKSSIHFNTRLANIVPLESSSSPSHSSSSHSGHGNGSGHGHMDSSILLQFTNGTTASCDVVFACDGLYSVVRACFAQWGSNPNPNPNPNPSPSNPSHQSFTPSMSMSMSIPPVVIPKVTDIHWTGSTVFKTKIPLTRLRGRYPDHRSLGGVVIVSLLSFLSFLLSYLFFSFFRSIRFDSTRANAHILPLILTHSTFKQPPPCARSLSHSLSRTNSLFSTNSTQAPKCT